MWSEARLGKHQPNEIRIAELRDTGAKHIAAACPHCLTMLESGKAMRKDGDEIVVEDIAEIVAKALPEENA